MQDKLKMMPDLHRISKRLQKGVANLEDVVRVYQCIGHLPGLIAIVESGGGGGDNIRWLELLEEVYLSTLRVGFSSFTSE